MPTYIIEPVDDEPYEVETGEVLVDDGDAGLQSLPPFKSIRLKEPTG